MISSRKIAALFCIFAAPLELFLRSTLEYLRVVDWVKANGKQMKRGAGGEFEEGQQAITAANLAMAWGVGKNGPRDYSKARSITIIL